MHEWEGFSEAHVSKGSRGPKAGSYRPSGMGRFKLSNAKGLVICLTLSFLIYNARSTAEWGSADFTVLAGRLMIFQ